jgi:hypothetical protein
VSAELVIQTIQLIIAPVVMVSACGLILNSVLARYASVNDRLRVMAHERWELLRSCTSASGIMLVDLDPILAERMEQIDIQIPQLLRRHRWLRDAAMLMYVAILLFVICMFLLAISALTGREALAIAIVVFLFGNFFLLLSVLRTAVEVHQSHRALHFEAQRVLGLGQPLQR